MVSLEQFWGEKAGGSALGLKASESVMTSCIELTCELEGEQGMALLDDKEEQLVGDVLGTDVIIDPIGLIIISILCPD